MSSFTYRCSALAITLICTMTGCRKSDYYCPGAPQDNCNYLDATSACMSNDDCSAPTSVCDTGGSQTCVQCVAPDQMSACTGTAPACGDDHTCRGCISHAECPGSDACLPDGSCADPSQVAYVQAGGTGAQPCTKGAPCGRLQEGVTAVNAGRPYIKISGTGTLADNTTTTIDGKAVTILADPGAKLDRTGDGVILEVRNTGADVRIYDLEITGASGGAGDVGISIVAGGTPKLTLTRVKVTNNTGGGISASGGTLTVSQGTISGNAGGGISVSGAQFDLTNNMIVKNGGVSSLVGGIDFSQIPAAGTHRLEFNTIATNIGNATINSGVNCGTVVMPVTFFNNIIFGNIVSGGGRQLGGSANCLATYSDVGPDTVSGGGNINMDPLFVDVFQNNFHLRPMSPAKDAGDPGASLAVDIDGDSRPQGSRRDMGADEIR